MKSHNISSCIVPEIDDNHSNRQDNTDIKVKPSLKTQTVNGLTVYEIDNIIPSDKCDDIIYIVENANLKNNACQTMRNQYRVKFSVTMLDGYINKIVNGLELPINLNVSKQFSYVRYEHGGLIHTHIDSYDEKNVLYTLLIYLNDDYDNGETYLQDNDKTITIKKKKGKAVIFEGSMIPHGCREVKGTKRILLSKLIEIAN